MSRNIMFVLMYHRHKLLDLLPPKHRILLLECICVLYGSHKKKKKTATVSLNSNNQLGFVADT
jgi:hypothetical protein